MNNNENNPNPNQNQDPTNNPNGYANSPNGNQNFDQNQNSNQNSNYNPNYNPNYAPPFNNGYNYKSKVAAGLLGIFLGTFGVHNFYLGFTGKAVTQLLLTVLSCGILAVVSSIWGFIEGILLLTGSINVDGNNMPLSN